MRKLQLPVSSSSKLNRNSFVSYKGHVLQELVELSQRRQITTFQKTEKKKKKTNSCRYPTLVLAKENKVQSRLLINLARLETGRNHGGTFLCYHIRNVTPKNNLKKQSLSRELY